MKLSDPITMLQFSISQPVFTETLERGPDQREQISLTVVQHVSWLEIRGDTVIFSAECWKPIARDIWQVMSQKK